MVFNQEIFFFITFFLENALILRREITFLALLEVKDLVSYINEA